MSVSFDSIEPSHGPIVRSLLRAGIVVMLAVAPLLLGSADPLFCGVWAGWVGLLYVALGLGPSAWSPMPKSRLLMVSGVLFGSAIAYMVVQALPAPWLGDFALLGRSFTQDQISVARGDSLLMALRHATYAGLFVLVITLTSRSHTRHSLLSAIVLIVTFQAAIGIISLRLLGDTAVGFDKLDHIGSATGTFTNRNVFAMMLAMGLNLAVGLAAKHVSAAREQRRPWWTDGQLLVNLACCAVILSGILLSNSRMGLMVAVGSSALVLAASLSSRTNLKPLAFTSLVAVVLFGGLLALYGVALIERLSDAGADAQTRGRIYELSFALIGERPLLGWGAGSFPQAVQVVRNDGMITDTVINRAHNTYFSVFAELGLVAGAAFFVALLLPFLLIVRHVTDRGAEWRIAVMCSGALLAAAIHSLVDYGLEIQSNALLWVTILALGCSAALHGAKKRTPGN